MAMSADRGFIDLSFTLMTKLSVQAPGRPHIGRPPNHTP